MFAGTALLLASAWKGLPLVAALDAVQIWRGNGCSGAGSSWVFIDDGTSNCRILATDASSAGQSWTPVASDSRYQHLYIDPRCSPDTAHMTVNPSTAITGSCHIFNKNSKRHIFAWRGSDGPAASLLPADDEATTWPAGANWGLAEDPTGAVLAFGPRLYFMSHLDHGVRHQGNHRVEAVVWHRLRTNIRAAWQANNRASTRSVAGIYADNIVYTLTASFQANTDDPYDKHDRANGQLLPGIMERLYFYWVNSGYCNVQVHVDSAGELGVLVIDMGASPC